MHTNWYCEDRQISIWLIRSEQMKNDLYSFFFFSYGAAAEVLAQSSEPFEAILLRIISAVSRIVEGI